MNRPGFLEKMLKAGAACMVLPPALTYKRRWVPTSSGVFVDTAYNCIIDPDTVNHYRLTSQTVRRFVTLDYLKAMGWHEEEIAKSAKSGFFTIIGD